MTTNEDIARRFSWGASEGGATNMFIEGDAIYSYGYHFPIARRICVRGRNFVLVNSSYYSVTTSKHQSYVEYFLRGEKVWVKGCDIDNVISQMENNDADIITFLGGYIRARTQKKARMENIMFLLKQNCLLREILPDRRRKKKQPETVGDFVETHKKKLPSDTYGRLVLSALEA